MVVVKASKVNLPDSSLPSLQVTSILFEPSSLSLALMHSDSSISLYPSLSLISPAYSSQTRIPLPCSCSTFLLLQSSIPDPNSNSDPRVLFIAAGPFGDGKEIVFRFFALRRKTKSFVRVQKVVASQKDIRFDKELGVLVNVEHGDSIKLSGSVNYFAMYTGSSSRVWIFAVKAEDGDDDEEKDGDSVSVKLMRCVVIECCQPIWSVSISFGILILGEENGVKVFNLRRLVKGKVKKFKKVNLSLKREKEGRGVSLPNGMVGDDHGTYSGNGQIAKRCSAEGGSEATRNYEVKLRSLKLREDDRDVSASFVELKGKEVQSNSQSLEMSSTSPKPISIQAFSQKSFLILDSAGDVHLLFMSNPIIGSDVTWQIRQLPHLINAQQLAVLPDSSMLPQAVWLSDGQHSIYRLAASDVDNDLSYNDNDRGGKLLSGPAIQTIQAIFSGEKILDVVPFSADSVLILGQGSLYAYTIS